MLDEGSSAESSFMRPRTERKVKARLLIATVRIHGTKLSCARIRRREP